MEFVGVLLALLKVAFVVGVIILVLRGTKKKGAMGVNLDAVKCCRCQTPMPRLRIPKDREEFAWGGWTCPKCGLRMGKWGKPRC